MPKLYDELAGWFPLLSPATDYEEEAACYGRTLAAASDAPVRSVLELGSGAGHNASHLKRHFDMVLVEPSAGMQAISRRLNPECEHIDADMRSLRRSRRYWRSVPFEHSELEPGSHEMFVAKKPGTGREPR